MALKFYTSVAKELKLKVRKFWGLILAFVEVPGIKLAGGRDGGVFLSSPILNKVKRFFTIIADGCFRKIVAYMCSFIYSILRKSFIS